MSNYCSKCGVQMAEAVKFCPSCGAPAQPANIPPADTTTGYDEKADIEQNKVMAVLAYLGILVLIPLFAAKESKFARYHANQGVILLIACVAWFIIDAILTAILWSIMVRAMSAWGLYTTLATVLNLVYIVFTVLAILGIVNAWNGKMKELPVIGKYKIVK